LNPCILLSLRRRVVEFIGVAWPKEHLEENLTFIADSIGPTNGEQPRDTIRRYLAIPVSAPPKWKLKNGDQRPAPKTRPARTEMAKIAGHRLGHANLTRENVADSHTLGNNTPETRLPGGLWRNTFMAPARPIPNWRSKPSAVAPVDDIDWVNGNLVGYRRTVKKLIRGPIPYSGARIPCSARNNSLFRQKNSLFHLLGNFAASI